MKLTSRTHSHVTSTPNRGLPSAGQVCRRLSELRQGSCSAVYSSDVVQVSSPRTPYMIPATLVWGHVPTVQCSAFASSHETNAIGVMAVEQACSLAMCKATSVAQNTYAMKCSVTSERHEASSVAFRIAILPRSYCRRPRQPCAASSPPPNLTEINQQIKAGKFAVGLLNRHPHVHPRSCCRKPRQPCAASPPLPQPPPHPPSPPPHQHRCQLDRPPKRPEVQVPAVRPHRINVTQRLLPCDFLCSE